MAAVVMTVLMSPFLFLGLAFTLGGSDGGDRVFGLVVLGLLGPGLFAIWRWAWPSRASD